MKRERQLMKAKGRGVKTFGLCLVLSLFPVAAGADGLFFKPSDARNALAAATELVRACTPRDAGTPSGRRAADFILLQLRRLGLPARLDPFVAQSRNTIRSYANVVVEFPARDPNAPWIVLMSHFDTKPGIAGFQGANDGASTSGLLVALAGVLRRSVRLQENLCLVWTDGEESREGYADNDGFQGSRHLAKQFRAKGRTVKAAICLDMLGDRDLNIVVPQNSTPSLRQLARQAADKAGFTTRLTFRDDIQIVDDHAAFFDAGFPALELIDFDYGSQPGLNDYWHTSQDTLDKITSASLFISGRIVVELLNLLTTSRPTLVVPRI